MMNVGNHSCVAQGFFNWELGDSKKIVDGGSRGREVGLFVHNQRLIELVMVLVVVLEREMDGRSSRFILDTKRTK